MKILKYALYAVVGVVILIVIAIAVAVATFDPNKYKGELARVVKEKTGRTLAVEGKIGVSLFPSSASRSARRPCRSATATRLSRGSTRSRCRWRCFPCCRGRS